MAALLLSLPCAGEKGVFRNSCGRTTHEDRRVEIEAAENANREWQRTGVPQQDAAEESMTSSAAARVHGA